MIFVIHRFTRGTFRFDPPLYDATTAGLACLEVHLAAVCAALPVFWPVLTTMAWGHIFVTTAVSVTRESGPFYPRRRGIESTKLHATSSRRNLTALDESQPQGWDPYVGDEATGLGENETVVEGPAGGKR
jgi:hypothetical protein